MFTGVGVGEGSEQQGSRMRTHMQAIGNKRDGAKQKAADNLGDHHDAAKPYYRPCLALALLMFFSQKYMTMEKRRRDAIDFRHKRTSFQISADDFK